jgi:cell division protein ZapE
MPLDTLGSLEPSSRFAGARFDAYRAGSPSQREAFRQARAFAERVTRPRSWGARLRAWLPGGPGPEAPRGLYLVGPAGTGKTHLMAAVFHALMPQTPCAFLHSGAFFRTAARPERLAEALAERGPDGPAVRALLLDEVELDDAANEARLAHFLRALADRGVALMATSNARPNEFLSRHHAGSGAHRRFLTDALDGQCETVLVRGDDRRRQRGNDTDRRGAIFVGPPDAARAALSDAYAAAEEPKRGFSFDELRRAATETAHARLVDELLQTDRLYIAGVRLDDTDDALRLLRLVDDLYTDDEAPALFFSAPAPPEEWFTSPNDADGLRAGVAEKFERTVSRLHELCDVLPMGDVRLAKDD